MSTIDANAATTDGVSAYSAHGPNLAEWFDVVWDGSAREALPGGFTHGELLPGRTQARVSEIIVIAPRPVRRGGAE